MSDSLAGLRRKLGAAQQLGAVVRAMKAISAAAIVQYERAVDSLREYQNSVELGLSLCLRDQGNPASESGAAKHPTGILVFGSDQGLVGRFNEAIVESVLKAQDNARGSKALWAVGERLLPSLEGAGLSVARQFVVPSSVTAITALVTEIQIEIEGYMAEHRHGEVQVFHNSPRALGHYEVVCERLLPLDAAWHRRLRKIAWPGSQLPQLLGDTTVSLPALIREYLFIALYRTCAESLASENASRLEAMQRAEQNIDRVAGDLRQSLNRLRQSSIDEELFDVIAGFNALA
jgi:F-type H+-transporting ATPase subunit gamma